MADNSCQLYKLAQCLFLDRDGVINVDRGYIHRWDQFELASGICELAASWSDELHRPIVVVTNQPGIGRGYCDECDYEDLTPWTCDCFEAEHTAIAPVYHCPYPPSMASANTVAIIRGANPTRV